MYKDWNEENIKKVAAVYNDTCNLSNITYQTTPDFVAFLTNGNLFTIHFRNNYNKITDECKDALCKEIEFHTDLLKELEE